MKSLSLIKLQGIIRLAWMLSHQASVRDLSNELEVLISHWGKYHGTWGELNLPYCLSNLAGRNHGRFPHAEMVNLSDPTYFPPQLVYTFLLTEFEFLWEVERKPTQYLSFLKFLIKVPPCHKILVNEMPSEACLEIPGKWLTFQMQVESLPFLLHAGLLFLV